MLYDVQPAAVSGVRGEFVPAPRLDNLASCHAALSALLGARPRSSPPAHAASIVLYDHEEVGSRSAQGAAGPLLADALERAVGGWKGGEPQGLARALARSLLVSADMAHAVHPNYADRHEPGHRPRDRPGSGDQAQRRTSPTPATRVTAGQFAALCRRRGITPQHFVTRSDIACGSTIGPITRGARRHPRPSTSGAHAVDALVPRDGGHAPTSQPMIDVLRLFLAGA